MSVLQPYLDLFGSSASISMALIFTADELSGTSAGVLFGEIMAICAEWLSNTLDVSTAIDAIPFGCADFAGSL